jgi:quinol monooxygenase YgiN
MYGTVARLKIKAGSDEALKGLTDQLEAEGVADGLVAQLVYRLKDDPSTLMLVAVFRDEESYKANADSPEQHERYLAFRSHLEADPEWHDGTIVFAQQVEPML